MNNRELNPGPNTPRVDHGPLTLYQLYDALQMALRQGTTGAGETTPPGWFQQTMHGSPATPRAAGGGSAGMGNSSYSAPSGAWDGRDRDGNLPSPLWGRW